MAAMTSLVSLVVVCCFILARATTRTNFVLSVSKLYDGQLKAYEEVDPEVGQSCRIAQSLPSLDIYVMCPTEVNCYLKTYGKRISILAFEADLSSHCEPTKGKPLPVGKRKQLNAVLRVLRLRNETVRKFRSVETLDARGTGLVITGQLGGAECEEDDVRGCPTHRLRYLNLSYNKVEHLSNRSFCRFKQLEYLSIAECSLRSIESDAFSALVNLKELVLRYNHLTQLPVHVFDHNTQLENIDLINNRLRDDVLAAISNVDSLRFLYVSFNRFIEFREGKNGTFPEGLSELILTNAGVRNLGAELSNSVNLTRLLMGDNGMERVEENAFQELRELQLLNLKSNEIEGFHERTFENTLKLEDLVLKDNELSEIPPVAHLARLKELKLSKNRISSIRKTDLVNCTQLSYVDLSENQLSYIEDGSFDNAKRLEILHLDHNRLSELSVNLKSSSILQLALDYNNFTIFSYEILPRGVTHLWFSFNQIDTIQQFDFEGGKGWNLVELYLDHNRIESIKNLKLPPSIQIVDLSFNGIREVFPLREVNNQYLFNLGLVDMKDNLISSVCVNLFRGFKPIIRIQYFISNNPFKCSAENLWIKYSPELDHFEFADLQDVRCQQTPPKNRSWVKLSQLSDERFLSRSDHVNSDRCECPPDGVTKCELPCPSDCTCYSNFDISIVHVFCDNKGFQNIPSDLQHLNYQNASVTLDLSSNNISHLGPIAFRSSKDRITLLNLRNSSIRSIHRDAFLELIHLESLDLSHNQLEVLPSGIFHRLNQLTTLDLSNNHLTYLADDTFISTVNIQYLFLHNNNLSHIQLSEIKRLNYLNNVSFQENPWSCDCAFIEPFRAFLVDSNTAVYDNLRVNCTENGRQFNIPNFNIERCFKKIYLTVVIVSLTFGLVIMTAIGVTFKWRHELQVMIYSRYGLRVFHRRQQDEEGEKLYDAFIAYNNDDSDFLVDQLVPGLEAIENPYRLCIHERDFLAGGFIQDNILEAVKISSRTIVVLSESFVRSGWCRFEFKTAHVQMMKDKCPRMLVVVLGEIPQTLDPEMQLYLKTNTYLRWGEKLFWQKLYYAMPDHRVASPPPNIMPMRQL